MPTSAEVCSIVAQSYSSLPPSLQRPCHCRLFSEVLDGGRVWASHIRELVAQYPAMSPFPVLPGRPDYAWGFGVSMDGDREKR
ncbi:hypothetical protein CPC08DRAFT_364889 [Agrocybe pediades]|nr:hypothetical protein CPC08DRAFT_364889 [Agrocybe pediades]